jgi:hypothetical protein
MSALVLQLLDEGGNVGRFGGSEFPDAMRPIPLREAASGTQVRLARVAVVDLGGAALKNALGALRRRREPPDGKCGRGRGLGRGARFDLRMPVVFGIREQRDIDRHRGSGRPLTTPATLPCIWVRTRRFE